MAERTPYEQIRDIRGTLIDHIEWLWTRSPVTPDTAEWVMQRLLGPVGAPAAKELTAAMWAAQRDPDDSPDRHIERAVDALLAVVGEAFRSEVHDLTDASLRRLGMAPETPLLAGDSPTTVQGEGVTGTSGGSNRVPVTPAGVTYVREAGWHVWSCGSCGEGGSGLAKSVAEAAYAAHSCPVTPAGGASWLD